MAKTCITFRSFNFKKDDSTPNLAVYMIHELTYWGNHLQQTYPVVHLMSGTKTNAPLTLFGSAGAHCHHMLRLLTL